MANILESWHLSQPSDVLPVDTGPGQSPTNSSIGTRYDQNKIPLLDTSVLIHNSTSVTIKIVFAAMPR